MKADSVIARLREYFDERNFGKILEIDEARKLLKSKGLDIKLEDLTDINGNPIPYRSGADAEHHDQYFRLKVLERKIDRLPEEEEVSGDVKIYDIIGAYYSVLRWAGKGNERDVGNWTRVPIYKRVVKSSYGR